MPTKLWRRVLKLLHPPIPVEEIVQRIEFIIASCMLIIYTELILIKLPFRVHV